jgi:hypothetical protein
MTLNKMAAFGVVVVLFNNLLDILLATLLLLKSKWTLKSWLNATADLDFCTCTIDLWLISISRFALITGAVLGRRLNPSNSHARLRLSRRPVFILSFGIIVYVLIKFLLSTECTQEHSLKVWLWCFLGHTCLFSLNLSWSWWTLSKKPALQRPVVVVNVNQEVGSVLDQDESASQSDSDDESSDSGDSSNDRFVCYFKTVNIKAIARVLIGVCMYIRVLSGRTCMNM